MILRILSLLIFLVLQIPTLQAQQTLSSAQIKLQIDKLNSLGSVLYFAAHPDDENTRLIAWLANEKKFKTAYLSLTRGDGGQNLLGTEQGIDLGLIRTQELLAARSIDKGEQYFTSAYDFGFSKTHEETFSFWKKEETLREAVYLIRQLQPDVIINRFPPDSRGGHGHHQASAMFAHEAFLAAADPKRFPEQLKTLKPWQAKRLVWNTANFGGMNNTSEDQLKVNIGAYNPLIGYSYGEISALSRSQHKSQGFGAATQRGDVIEYFDHVAGDKAQSDLFEGIKTDWSRLNEPGLTQPIEQEIKSLQNSFDPNHPGKSIPALAKLHQDIQKLKNSFWKSQKIKEVEGLLLACAGMYVEATSNKPGAVIAEAVPFSLDIISRSEEANASLKSINGKPANKLLTYNKPVTVDGQITAGQSSQPYWLIKPHSLGKFEVEERNFGKPENLDPISVELVFQVAGVDIPVKKPIKYRYVDPVDGEILQPISISPKFTAAFTSNNLLIQENEEKTIGITVMNHGPKTEKGNLTFTQSNGLEIHPNKIAVEIPAGQSWSGQISIKNPKNTANSTVNLQFNGETLSGYKNINYPHIPSITWFPALTLQVKKLDLVNPIKKVAFIAGAGDLIPSSLENIGIQVDQLTEQLITSSSLKNYDAVVVGVRAYNVSKHIQRWMPELLKYVEEGGVALVQYNVNSKMGITQLGPYPFQINRSRVTEEDAKVVFNDKNDPVLNYPNKITVADFDGWVQERGLYFADQIDAKYRTPLTFSDKNESPNKGSLLIANYGKGKFVYTSLAFFRQLPAGVPGATRLFVNLLTKEEK